MSRLQEIFTASYLTSWARLRLEAMAAISAHANRLRVELRMWLTIVSYKGVLHCGLSVKLACELPHHDSLWAIFVGR
jgi:hypothetical protein